MGPRSTLRHRSDPLLQSMLNKVTGSMPGWAKSAGRGSSGQQRAGQQCGRRRVVVGWALDVPASIPIMYLPEGGLLQVLLRHGNPQHGLPLLSCLKRREGGASAAASFGRRNTKAVAEHPFTAA